MVLLRRGAPLEARERPPRCSRAAITLDMTEAARAPAQPATAAETTRAAAPRTALLALTALTLSGAFAFTPAAAPALTLAALLGLAFRGRRAFT